MGTFVRAGISAGTSPLRSAAQRHRAPKAIRTVGLVTPADRPLTEPVAAFRRFALGYQGRLLA